MQSAKLFYFQIAYSSVVTNENYVFQGFCLPLHYRQHLQGPYLTLPHSNDYGSEDFGLVNVASGDCFSGT